jgi:hypothetical protein
MNIFINCPLDAKYTPLFRSMIFTLMYLGLEPRISIEDTECSQNRLDKIFDLMKQSDISIHDLSRIKSSGSDEYYRLNMPFELGIDYGLRLAFADSLSKKFIVLEDEKYSYHKGLSDYSGFDVLTHSGNPARMVKVLRDWFVNNGIVESAKGGTAIWYEYNDCWAYIYDRLLEKGYSEEETDEIPYNEYKAFVAEWLSIEGNGA